MNKRAKIATIAALIVVSILIITIAFAAPRAPKKCDNGSDDDNDGLVDYPKDPGCSSSRDTTETSIYLICDNGVDETNDADTLADYRLSGGDAGCTSATDNNERDGLCDDLSDNDGDGLTDRPSDPECGSYADVEHE